MAIGYSTEPEPFFPQVIGYLLLKSFKFMLSVEYLAASYLCSDKFSPNLTVQIMNVYIVYVKCRTCFFIVLLCKVQGAQWERWSNDSACFLFSCHLQNLQKATSFSIQQWCLRIGPLLSPLVLYLALRWCKFSYTCVSCRFYLKARI